MQTRFSIQSVINGFTRSQREVLEALLSYEEPIAQATLIADYEMSKGTNALRRLMLVINGAYLGKAVGQETKKAALERDPGCKSIWPDIPE